MSPLTAGGERTPPRYGRPGSRTLQTTRPVVTSSALTRPVGADEHASAGGGRQRVEFVVSSTLQDPQWVRDLIAAGLVDEYRLFVYPVVLGRGERLFADATDVTRLRQVEAKPFRAGIVLLRYRVT